MCETKPMFDDWSDEELNTEGAAVRTATWAYNRCNSYHNAVLVLVMECLTDREKAKFLRSMKIEAETVREWMQDNPTEDPMGVLDIED